MKPLPPSPINEESSLLSLASASQAQDNSFAPAALIESTGRRAMAISQADRCAVFIRQKDGSYTCPWYLGLSTSSIQKLLLEAADLNKGMFSFRSGPLIIPDTRRLSTPLALSVLAREESYRAVQMWPYVSKGKVAAAVACFYDKPHSPNRSEYKAMTAFMNQAGPGLEQMVTPAEQHPAAVLDGLYDLSRQLSVNDSLEILLDRFVKSAVEIVQASSCRVFTRETDDTFVLQAAWPARAPGRPLPESQAGQFVFERVILSDGPFLLRRSDVTLTTEARLALELDNAHTLCMVPLRVDLEPVGILVLGENRPNESFHIEKIRLATMVADLVASLINRERLYHRLEESYLETILALTRTLEARDPYTAGHSKKLVDLVEKTGRRLGCSPARQQQLRWAGLLHDIGKIGVPDEILRRPGPLTAEEWEIMKQHPQIGADIIRPVTSLAAVAPFILAHHERYDGTGYPHSLKGEEIPLEARILSVVDAYCAMTDGRIYRSAMTYPEAVAELKRCSGKNFDPLVVDVFINLVD